MIAWHSEMARRKPLVERIAEAEQKLEAEKQKAQQRQARARAALDRLRRREADRDRKRDTRRKVLAGAMVLQWLGDEERRRDTLTQLNAFLTKDRDRALFPELDGDR